MEDIYHLKDTHISKNINFMRMQYNEPRRQWFFSVYNNDFLEKILYLWIIYKNKTENSYLLINYITYLNILWLSRNDIVSSHTFEITMPSSFSDHSIRKIGLTFVL